MPLFYSSDGHLYSLHLPTKTWLPDTAAKISRPLNATSFQYVHHSQNLPTKIFNLSNDGTVREIVSFKSPGGFWDLLPHAPQVLIPSTRRKYDELPGWLRSILGYFELTREWMDRSQDYLSVYDYEKQRDVWSKEVGPNSSFSYSLTDRWLMLQESEYETNTLTVTLYAVPFPSWSPWWARGAGLFIVLMAWLLNRGRGHAVLSVSPAG